MTDPCSHCRGSGTETRTRDVRTRIPPGVRNGARIRLKGKGEAGSFGGPPGDLYVNVHVAAHELFGQRGRDLTMRLPVTIAEAALGTQVEVPTLEDPVTVKIPAGTQPGKTLRVRGKGPRHADGRRGDLLVTVDVVVPSKLTKTQRKMLESFADTDQEAAQKLRRHIDSAISRAEQGV